MGILDRLKRLLRRGSPSGEAPSGAVPGGGGPPAGGAGGAGGIPCDEALARLMEYLDGELRPGSAAEVEEHLRVCALCYPHLAFERSFLEAVARAQAGQPVPQRLRARVLDALAQEGLPDV